MIEEKDKFYLEHILEAIENIESFLKDKSKDDFLSDKMLQSAIIRQLEIIGEASKRISAKKKEQSPQTEWKNIAGIRDVLIHDYFGIDLESIWNTLSINIPELKIEIGKILQ
ncbi:MAG: hypothetical protein US31_C0019G0016 [Berkelbacteria bacterium GW2011_GWA1_36_9]|uniref:Nucleotidyltransferase n=1 Tax=Berkelbacteria bacterium GW2011_GWA1_36_9 TaxID=1618331 RepID=A0A0G0HZH8_9BACT|nr:MAG: hypothetical protein US31_C0019G0016 [Berkelbacteria bacterium GW2011_GWA1_36_9]